MLTAVLAAAMIAGLGAGTLVHAEEEPVTITFGFWGDDAEASMKMGLANKYMEEHPNVTIEMEYCNGADLLGNW